jgi:rhodanese-related sulfurtransferase
VLLEGGMDAWRQSGGAVETAKGPIGLERQVRIAAGLLVLAGLAIPHGIWLTAFVGAGLVFAGITDTCAMGMLIAKMPWNRPPRSGRGPEGTDRAAA